MNTKVVGVAVAVIVVLAAAWYALSAEWISIPNGDVSNDENAQVLGPAEPMPGDVSETTTTTTSTETVVTLTDSGFSPATVTVQAGDAVRFVNQSSRGMWVGSDDHPTHTDYDGTSTREHCADGVNTTGTFDQCQQVPAGQSWSFTFSKAGTFGYHNHTGASNTGTVIVQ